MQWYGVDWTGPAPTSQSADQVTVTAVNNHLPQYLYEILQREISPDSIHMSNIDKKYVLVRAFVNTFSDM